MEAAALLEKVCNRAPRSSLKRRLEADVDTRERSAAGIETVKKPPVARNARKGAAKAAAQEATAPTDAPVSAETAAAMTSDKQPTARNAKKRKTEEAPTAADAPAPAAAPAPRKPERCQYCLLNTSQWGFCGMTGVVHQMA